MVQRIPRVMPSKMFSPTRILTEGQPAARWTWIATIQTRAPSMTALISNVVILPAAPTAFVSTERALRAAHPPVHRMSHARLRRARETRASCEMRPTGQLAKAMEPVRRERARTVAV